MESTSQIALHQSDPNHYNMLDSGMVNEKGTERLEIESSSYSLDSDAEPTNGQEFFRRLQVNQDLPMQQEQNDPTCGVVPPREIEVSSTWASSYPGSGAKLTWKLIRAFTGMWTGDDFDNNGRVGKGICVAIKTHYPSHTPESVFMDPKFRTVERAVLLLRNPMMAIPSYHNYVYEKQNNLRNHSTRAPIDAWLKFRNSLFDVELNAWVEHAQWWMNNFRGHLYILSFENLTSEEKGVNELLKMAGFFAKSDRVIARNMVKVENLECIWKLYVQNNEIPGERERRKSHRDGGPSEYPFTVGQLNRMIDSILRLRDLNMSRPEFADLLLDYVYVIEKRRNDIRNLVIQ